MRLLCRLLSCCLTLALLLAAQPAAALPVSTHRGLVVAAHPAAARAGARVLAEGGNAADALVAAAFAVGVAEPFSSGLGGGGFALYFDAATGVVHALDFRETAPAAAGPELFEKNGVYVPALSREGGRSVGVPGAVAGYAALAKAHGSMPLKKLVRPAAELAEKGLPISAGYVRALGWSGGLFDRLPQKLFPTTGPLLGERLKQPALARLLRDIGAKGPKAFYEGKAAQAIVRSVQATGGVMTTADLAAYRPRAVTPLEIRYRGHRVVTMPPPSAGGMTVAQTLLALERLPQGAGAYHSVERLQRVAETWKRSYAARAAWMGDSRGQPEVDEALAQLVSGETMDRWVKSMGAEATPLSEAEQMAESINEGPETSHLCAIDRKGNVALMTTTINAPFGSGVVVTELGVVLNNELDDFSPPSGGNLYGLEGGRFNRIAPGRAPLSTMAPTLVFDGDRPWIGVGAAGGSTIATTIAQVIANVVEDGMDVQQAVAAPRLHQQLRPDELRVEPFGLDPDTRKALEMRGYGVRVMPSRWGNAAALTLSADGLRQGAADPRGEGAAVAEDQLDR